MTVAAILATKGNAVLTVDQGSSLKEIISILAEKRIGAVIVKKGDGSVCGIISERDIVQEMHEKGSSALSSTVSDCMTSNVISCTRSSTINEVMEIMTSNRFRHMPVIEKGKLEGIISIGDVVKEKIKQAERDAEDMRNYIAAS